MQMQMHVHMHMHVHVHMHMHIGTCRGRFVQLEATSPRAWSFPNWNGSLALAEFDGPCTKLPLLKESREGW